LDFWIFLDFIVDSDDDYELEECVNDVPESPSPWPDPEDETAALEEEEKICGKKKSSVDSGRPFKCGYCTKGFSIQKYLDSHITNKHPEKCEINSQVIQGNGEYR